MLTAPPETFRQPLSATTRMAAAPRPFRSGLRQLPGIDEKLKLVRTKAGMIGSAPLFLDALFELARFASVDVPILIAGETGTGKEIAARAIHYLSARSGGPFVPVNCGALPERLLENELFGHGRGAFTDAREERLGLIAQAAGGTLLLDEIDCLDAHAQAALLRVLQDRRYRPLGAEREREADIKIVASSNAHLETLVEQGRFRADLLFRLDVARIELPPLRERREDILPLARHFLQIAAERYGIALSRLSSDSERWLLTQRWPGNIRQLENAMHRALLLADSDIIEMLGCAGQCRSDAPIAGSVTNTEFQGTLKSQRARTTEAFERTYLLWLLQATRGNISEAARRAGTERRHLGRMIRRHGIDVSAFTG